jgi:hypothetical protein
MAVTGEELGLPGGVSADDHTSDDIMENDDGQSILSYNTPNSKLEKTVDVPPWETDSNAEKKTVTKTIKKKLSNDNPLEQLMQSFNHTGT